MFRRLIPFVLVLGLVACGGSDSGGGSPTSPTTPTTPTTPAANRAPVIASVTATPSFGIQNLTAFSFTSNASDPDGDGLTYSWNIAGNSVSGQNVGPYTFVNGFSGTASITVTDGKGGSATGSANFVVGSATGTWAGSFAGYPFAMILQQSSVGLISGTFAIQGASRIYTGRTDPAATNKIDANANVVLRFKVDGNFDDFIFNGTMDSTGLRMTGSAQGSGFTGQPVVFLKQ